MILATLVYVVKDDQVLMIHRNQRPDDLHFDKYNGLGGKFEEGESPRQCAIRELKEESGLDALELSFKGQILFPKFDKHGRDWLVFIYTVHHFEGELIKLNHEGELKWISQEKILELNLWDGDKLFIPLVFSNSTFEGAITYQNGKVTDHQIFLSSN